VLIQKAVTKRIPAVSLAAAVNNPLAILVPGATAPFSSLVELTVQIISVHEAINLNVWPGCIDDTLPSVLRVRTYGLEEKLRHPVITNPINAKIIKIPEYLVIFFIKILTPSYWLPHGFIVSSCAGFMVKVYIINAF